jgi:hypothetical protein
MLEAVFLEASKTFSGRTKCGATSICDSGETHATSITESMALAEGRLLESMAAHG